MASTTRFGMRFAQQAFRTQKTQTLRFAQRRTYQSAAENPANIEAPSNESAFKKLWNSPVGPKTVHFWAPIMKVRQHSVIFATQIRQALRVVANVDITTVGRGPRRRR